MTPMTPVTQHPSPAGLETTIHTRHQRDHRTRTVPARDRGLFTGFGLQEQLSGHLHFLTVSRFLRIPFHVLDGWLGQVCAVLGRTTVHAGGGDDSTRSCCLWAGFAENPVRGPADPVRVEAPFLDTEGARGFGDVLFAAGPQGADLRSGV